MTVHLLANPAARGSTAADDRAAAVAAIRSAGHHLVDVTAESPSGSLTAARTAVADGADRLVVVGGDGLVHIAVQALAGTQTVLGLVPQGTGNDFARALGLLGADLPATIESALGEPVAVDALRTTHGWGATVATLGFAGDVNARANAMRFPRGATRYSLATLLQLPRLRRLQITATLDDETCRLDTTMLSIGNTAFFGGGMKTCPGAQPFDGEMEIVVVGAISRRTFLRVFPKVFGGSHVDHPAVSVMRGRSLRLESPDEAIDVWVDGELLGPLPVDIEVVAGALQVAGVTRSPGRADLSP